ncbi:hypothetical protein SAMN04488556_0889 [Halostagnicola kamekurae]|uniref:Uncharacterized protein n=1 Tax=Halostagnicola kamekurae TaxID=619731 RepID=A0A1I6PZI1_9EURY|nr:hypothetical protein SAMN04488556_0889 [Halostagnicola kamekurae]
MLRAVVRRENNRGQTSDTVVVTAMSADHYVNLFGTTAVIYNGVFDKSRQLSCDLVT